VSTSTASASSPVVSSIDPRAGMSPAANPDINRSV
jgi:hypothetical protein